MHSFRERFEDIINEPYPFERTEDMPDREVGYLEGAVGDKKFDEDKKNWDLKQQAKQQ